METRLNCRYKGCFNFYTWCPLQGGDADMEAIHQEYGIRV